MAQTLASELNQPLNPSFLSQSSQRMQSDPNLRTRAAKARELEPLARAEETRLAEQTGLEEARLKREQIGREEKLATEGMGRKEQIFGTLEDSYGQQPERTITAFNPERGIELATMTALLGAFAGSVSGTAALKAMEGVSTGYRTGQEDLYKREVEAYDAAVNQYKQKIKQAEEIAKNSLVLEAEKRGLGAIELKKLDPLLNDGLIIAKAKQGDVRGMLESIKQAKNLGDQISLLEIEAGFKPSTKPRFAQLKVEGTDSEGNKKTLIFNPYDENFDPALMQNPTPDTPGFAGFAAEKAQNIGSRETGFAGRVQQALSSAATDIGNIIKSPGIAEMPVFAGTIGQNPKGVLDSLIALGARGSTAEEQRAFQMLTSGISAALGRIESQGLANGTTVANLKAFDEMKPLAGDSPLVTALYLARLKQELEVGLSVYVTNRATSAEQRAQVKGVVEPILNAINFEPSDVLNAMAKSNAGQGTNLLERARRLINQPVGTVAETPQDLSVKYTIANDPAAIQIRRELQNGTISIETARAQLKALGYE
jgi:hypothetical protein